jgi:hypothetical protein
MAYFTGFGPMGEFRWCLGSATTSEWMVFMYLIGLVEPA